MRPHLHMLRLVTACRFTCLHLLRPLSQNGLCSLQAGSTVPNTRKVIKSLATHAQRHTTQPHELTQVSGERLAVSCCVSRQWSNLIHVGNHALCCVSLHVHTCSLQCCILTRNFQVATLPTQASSKDLVLAWGLAW